MSFVEIPPFITEKEREYFLSKIDDPDWYQHKSTVSAKQSPLQFKQISFRGIAAALMKMDPNTIQDWHTDGINLKRNTLILHPISDNYSPFTCKSGSTSKPIIANTQEKHAVFNNNNVRLNLQIPFVEEYNDVHSNKNSVVWKLLDRFYEENNEQY